MRLSRLDKAIELHELRKKLLQVRARFAIGRISICCHHDHNQITELGCADDLRDDILTRIDADISDVELQLRDLGVDIDIEDRDAAAT